MRLIQVKPSPRSFPLISLFVAYLLAFSTSISLAKTPTRAQLAGGCYMVDSTGRTINLGSLCGGSSTGQRLQSANARVIRTPIKRRSGMTPIIEVTFNGSRRFEMIVDTGASGTLITRAMADALQVNPTGKVKAQIADGSTVEFQTGRVQSIAVQGAAISNVEVAIADRMSVGLLGHDFFGNYDVKILANTVEFHRR